MGDYITVASVRRTCGILISEINDADVTSTITEVEAQIPRYFNTVFIPTERIEILDGDGTNTLLLDKNPILSVRELKIDSTTEEVENLEINKQSGYIYLGDNSTISKFREGQNKVVIKYLYGSVVDTSTSSTTSADEVAGTSISVSLASITDFSDNDWVEIKGMDGKREVAQIDGTPAAGAIILDKLVLSHESGSTVTKISASENFIKLMNLVASIALVARIVGQSYTDIVGYNLGEMHVQKGEPYTQWRETANQFIKERDALMKRIRIRPYII